MKLKSMATAAGLVCVSLVAPLAWSADNQVVIGDIDDLSGVYADVIGQGGIEAANMAIADFGGSVLGKKIVLLTADHQNKPDIGASKFREWADQNGVNMILGGSNTGVSIAMAKVAGSDGVFRVADRCVQVMGGAGVTSDSIVEKLFRELRAFRIYDGPTEVHKWSLAKGIKRKQLGRA